MFTKLANQHIITLLSTGTRIRTLIKGFGDLYSTVELCPYTPSPKGLKNLYFQIQIKNCEVVIIKLFKKQST